MRVLLVYPSCPETFWSFHHALRFIRRRAAYPPLGLLTVASMLPKDWEARLVDLNVSSLKDRDFEGVDIVFLSAMAVQRDSALKMAEDCRRRKIPVAAGGPLFTLDPAEFDHLDYLVLGEAESSLPIFIDDLEKGRPAHRYLPDGFPDLAMTPLPRWDLIRKKAYASMNLQYSRGCPYDCDFCSITILNGHRPRTKSADQMIAELDSLYHWGWRGSVFFVDDNFIGNRRALKEDLLPAVIRWMEKRRRPFVFNTEASIDLADDRELMDLMVSAGFDTVFVGIETPHPESLEECHKVQNRRRDLPASIKILQRSGLQVQGGFILGFDSDPDTIFDQVINFIQKTGIVTAMVGLLNAPTGTHLYQRLLKENRILQIFNGDNTSQIINFIPRMPLGQLLAGYRRVVGTLYSPREYYRRLKVFLLSYQPRVKGGFRPNLAAARAFARSLWVLGVRGRERFQYWRLLAWAFFRKPRLLPLAVTLAIYGYHFRLVYENS